MSIDAVVTEDRSRGHVVHLSASAVPASAALRYYPAEPRSSSHAMPCFAVARVRAYDGPGIVDEFRKENFCLGFQPKCGRICHARCEEVPLDFVHT